MMANLWMSSCQSSLIMSSLSCGESLSASLVIFPRKGLRERQEQSEKRYMQTERQIYFIHKGVGVYV